MKKAANGRFFHLTILKEINVLAFGVQVLHLQVPAEDLAFHQV